LNPIDEGPGLLPSFGGQQDFDHREPVTEPDAQDHANCPVGETTFFDNLDVLVFDRDALGDGFVEPDPAIFFGDVGQIDLDFGGHFGH